MGVSVVLVFGFALFVCDGGGVGPTWLAALGLLSPCSFSVGGTVPWFCWFFACRGGVSRGSRRVRNLPFLSMLWAQSALRWLDRLVDLRGVSVLPSLRRAMPEGLYRALQRLGSDISMSTTPEKWLPLQRMRFTCVGWGSISRGATIMSGVFACFVSCSLARQELVKLTQFLRAISIWGLDRSVQMFASTTAVSQGKFSRASEM